MRLEMQPEEPITSALARRAEIPMGQTDAFRVFDGAGDGIDDLSIDTFAGRWLVSTRGARVAAGVLEAAGDRTVYWKRLDPESKRAPVHVAGPVQGAPFVATESGLRYEIDFAAGYSQGIFLDQRMNRMEVGQLVRDGETVLNLFAYTCAFSVVAARGGAVTTSLDLSGNYLEWGKRNFRLNEMDPKAHYFCKGDALDWLGRWRKAGRRFGGVILDPPTFSRTRGKVWRVESDFAALVAAAAEVLEPGGWMLCSTNFRGIEREAFLAEVRFGLAEAGRRGTVVAAGMPPEFSGERYLKCCWVEAE
ncbi:hypothetical protein BH23VER1_BH23VER1_33990 [soil metagenome]